MLEEKLDVTIGKPPAAAKLEADEIIATPLCQLLVYPLKDCSVYLSTGPGIGSPINYPPPF
jgi:hypothetical protein